MRYRVTITFNKGATILPEDQTPVIVERWAATPGQVAKMQAAAITLEAVSITIDDTQLTAIQGD